ncbi:MAG: sulfotransferase [Halioglobus sp.]|nr:sulfotransferase [Halioglobus sp.]
MKPPEFICIGAPKSGTTWLFDNLVLHPEIWLPPTKSIQYYSGMVNRRRLKKLWRGLRNKNINRGNARFSLRDSKELAQWKLKYFFWPVPNEHWYLSLFSEAGAKIRGEIAPSYTSLKRSKIAQIEKVAPNAKIIFFMRNPIDRAWSHFLHTYIKNGRKDIGKLSDEEIINTLDYAPSVLLSDYVATIDRWGEYFPSDQILVCFFEEIAESPDDLIERLCQFLDVKSDKSLFQQSSRRNIFKGVNEEMPVRVRAYLSDKFYAQLDTLASRYQSYPIQWLKDADAAIVGSQ